MATMTKECALRAFEAYTKVFILLLLCLELLSILKLGPSYIVSTECSSPFHRGAGALYAVLVCLGWYGLFLKTYSLSRMTLIYNEDATPPFWLSPTSLINCLTDLDEIWYCKPSLRDFIRIKLGSIFLF
jgi:hypothetical protein